MKLYKSYEDAVYKVAEEYAHAAHDSMFASVNMDKVSMIAFLFGLYSESVADEVKNTFEENREVFWK